MSWLDHIHRDPVPWLLDPENPSVRVLTLRHIFNRPEESLDAEYRALLAWKPVQTFLRYANPVSFWGRSENPFFGAAAGTFGILYTLAQLNVPRYDIILDACEHLLNRGRLADGRFAPDAVQPEIWLCYTGMALQLLNHFGFGDDPRVQSACFTLTQAILQQPQQLFCPIAGSECAAGFVKALAGLESLPAAARTPENTQAMQQLADRLLRWPFDWERRHADWLRLRFIRYYETDLLELAHVLAHSGNTEHPRLREFTLRLATQQDDEGRWHKTRAAALEMQIERIFQPSRWLTFEAVHTMMLVYGGNAYASRGTT
ncbi:MAG: hypothetical protein RBT75_16365 [Anaerolineae bacterium]|jgi:hypothetical protein|nr:hypothetical protein [Anaerolineae bacterium]